MDDITVRELSKMWIKYKEKQIKKTSLLQYQRIIEKHIDVYLGSYTLSRLKVRDILNFIDKIDDNISSKTLQDI